jgi:hypothetical protein
MAGRLVPLLATQVARVNCHQFWGNLRTIWHFYSALNDSRVFVSFSESFFESYGFIPCTHNYRNDKK